MTHNIWKTPGEKQCPNSNKMTVEAVSLVCSVDTTPYQYCNVNKVGLHVSTNIFETIVWSKILEIYWIIEIRDGMRKLITFLWIFGSWILKLDCTQGLPKIEMKTDYAKDNWDMECKLWKIMKFPSISWTILHRVNAV